MTVRIVSDLKYFQSSRRATQATTTINQSPQRRTLTARAARKIVKTLERHFEIFAHERISSASSIARS
jgi:hypothetical protein